MGPSKKHIVAWIWERCCNIICAGLGDPDLQADGREECCCKGIHLLFFHIFRRSDYRLKRWDERHRREFDPHGHTHSSTSTANKYCMWVPCGEVSLTAFIHLIMPSLIQHCVQCETHSVLPYHGGRVGRWGSFPGAPCFTKLPWFLHQFYTLAWRFSARSIKFYQGMSSFPTCSGRFEQSPTVDSVLDLRYLQQAPPSGPMTSHEIHSIVLEQDAWEMKGQVEEVLAFINQKLLHQNQEKAPFRALSPK